MERGDKDEMRVSDGVSSFGGNKFRVTLGQLSLKRLKRLPFSSFSFPNNGHWIEIRGCIFYGSLVMGMKEVECCDFLKLDTLSLSAFGGHPQALISFQSKNSF